MTFEAYLSAIKSRTGRTPEQLKSEHDLGHGHSMAVWAAWKSKCWVQAPSGKKK